MRRRTPPTTGAASLPGEAHIACAIGIAACQRELTVGIDPDAASDLFAVLANREHRLPTVIASQSGPDDWAQALPDRVAADNFWE